MKNLLYRLLFTRDDDMDLLQLFYLIIIIFFIISFSLAASGKWTITNAAWTALVSIFGTLSISGTPKWIAALLARKESNRGNYYDYNFHNNSEIINDLNSNETLDNFINNEEKEIG